MGSSHQSMISIRNNRRLQRKKYIFRQGKLDKFKLINDQEKELPTSNKKPRLIEKPLPIMKRLWDWLK